MKGFFSRRALLGGLVLALCGSLSGCGYSLAGRGSFLPAYIKTIGIPMFVNNSSVFEVERRVTDRVRSEFIGRGKYKVMPDTNGVDAILSGEISSITIAPATFKDGQAIGYVLTLTANMEFKDVKAGKVLWSNPAMQFREEYDVVGNSATATDPNAFFGQDVNALERLASEFARTVVSAILEAF